MSQPFIYVIGSLRNPVVPTVGNQLRDAGYGAFDQWYGGGRDADDELYRYAKQRGWSYKEALHSDIVRNTYEFDRRHLQRCAGGVLVRPAGTSAHLELGYIIGLGKPGWVLFPSEPDRFDVMYRFCLDVGADICFSTDELLASMGNYFHGVPF